MPLVPATRNMPLEFMVDLAAAGLGVAYPPALMVPTRPGLKAVRVDEPNFRRRLGFVWPGDSPSSRRK